MTLHNMGESRRGARTRARAARLERGPVIHFAAREDAHELIHTGPALCRAGYAARTERDQIVIGQFGHVTCKTCIRRARAQLRREETA